MFVSFILFMIGITREGQRGAKGRIRPAGRSLPTSAVDDTDQPLAHALLHILDGGCEGEQL